MGYIDNDGTGRIVGESAPIPKPEGERKPTILELMTKYEITETQLYVSSSVSGVALTALLYRHIGVKSDYVDVLKYINRKRGTAYKVEDLYTRQVYNDMK